MPQVIGATFKKAGKIYYFKPNGIELNIGDKILAETARGLELGEVIIDSKEIAKVNSKSELKPIKKKADDNDIQQAKRNEKEAEKAFEICEEKIAEHKLPMKLIDSEYTFDKGKLLFYFTADGRIDFRELVKDLASIFRTRIELRQIGVRDETKLMGGIGQCGRSLCCKTFLREFDPITIKMAKDQDLSLNPEKISGICGRLMCCLKYESDNYLETKDDLPDIGEEVEIGEEVGTVTGLNVVKETLTVELSGQESIEVSADDIEEKKED
ncbi:cell fate regulator YaaT (PSP1 superfamily) [Orenia metallireducens]|uniref:Cell fate regulator YaaT, PSP1 superfamily (Controls sporulation, competence, biofilm development) n=1 Tax=Orenia metallireducens TaxID=1413210 RepID=A0A285GZD7_9FIRM|nr:stage 0 sporulation family protein [Orenia metallireducens]PRX26445.1 cell fate regulator YaaT (PSP1 superfamily) [Orenia metallireducens]SNY28673.1 Cell fate regulator YaaT, PSP1 superfamily (controls sporulation, competence, biofilm development) [Orenia metallireducens]